MVATSMMSEGIGMLLGRFIYHDNMIIVIEGNALARWEIYVITLTVRIITLWITYMVCRKFCYRITWKDFLVVDVYKRQDFFQYDNWLRHSRSCR